MDISEAGRTEYHDWSYGQFEIVLLRSVLHTVATCSYVSNHSNSQSEPGRDKTKA